MAGKCFHILLTNPEAARIFDRAMTSLSNLAIKAVVEAYDFSEIETLVDVAGGHGRLLTTILEEYPKMHGVLFDQSHVIEGAKDNKQIGELKERCELASG